MEQFFDSVISGAMGGIEGKYRFWQQGPGEMGTLWQNSETLTPETVVKMLGLETEIIQRNPELKMRLGMMWEFVYGQEPPAEITEMRQRLLAKVARSEDLTETEILWQTIIAVDTDSF